MPILNIQICFEGILGYDILIAEYMERRDIYMDIRVLRYFLMVAREGSFSAAAKALYISQPTLSRQIRDLEEELGVSLLIRTNRSVVLTKEGMRFHKRAQEIVDLADMTREEFAQPVEEISGSVYIGAGETGAMRVIVQAATQMRHDHPGVHFHLHSGNSDDVLQRLEKGLIDFGVLIEPVHLDKYEALRLPCYDRWGILMRRDHPLASLAEITPKDIEGIPMMSSRQSAVAKYMEDWLGDRAQRLNLVGTYNLIFNAALMVESGMVCLFCLDHLVNTRDHTNLCFRPLSPRMEAGVHIVWKKTQIFSPAAETFLQYMRSLCVETQNM